ncbi:acetyl-CoA carboxylase biotin carboxyl carrier protein subunit [Streptomyces sp. PA03-1a]|nr:acetyl-CoA carboxylase biotin carboxyl carrier protein subunit [Streptomyces sp. PA03-1a]MDX2818000.1 acetyl-CoA carboxylase biotin carboxyl carrier protein subunit [Streptomyces sp. PA03-5A]
MTLHGDDRTARPPGAGKALNGTSPGSAPAALPVLDAVCRSATELARSMPTPPQRIRLRHGQTAVEIEWPQPQAEPPASTAAHIAAPAPAAEAAAAPATPPAAAPAPASSAGRAQGAPEAQQAHGAHDSTSLHYVCAPTVGTFYHAPEPGERPCVSLGDLVRPGQPVGVLEVMKMMSVVEADVAGRVVEVVVPDGQPVEFQQALIALEPIPVGE